MLGHIRNIGIIAHIDAGKTTTSENMLFYSGLLHRVGSIDDGTTALDYLDEERARGITIVSAAATFEWCGHLIHLIDTPGHIDFTAEVERSLRVIDGAVVIFSGVEGVEAQSEKVWHQADRYRVPKIAFINKLDRLGASFDRVCADVNAKFGDCGVAIQAPVGVESAFCAVVDLIRMEMIRFTGDDHETVERLPIPAEIADEMARRREHMLERLADRSDELAERYLSGQAIEPEFLVAVVRSLTLAGKAVPILAGTAKGRIGVQPLMDAIVSLLPSPADFPTVPAIRVKDGEPVEVKADPAAPFAGLVFKVVANTTADLLYLRTYSGVLKPGAKLTNSRTHAVVNIKQVLRLFAKNTQPVESVGPGDIVGLIGLRDCGTGDTLCDARHLVALEPMAFPEPVISMAVEPKSSRDKDRLSDSLDLLCREDPTLTQARDEETGQRLLGGMGELHLEIKLKRLEQEFNVPVRAGEPRVAYRETFKADDTVAVQFHKVIGDNELQAGVTIRFRPLERGGDLFRTSSKLGRKSGVPPAFCRAAERALADGLRTGGNRGYPLIYVEAEILDLELSPDKTTEPAVIGAVLMAIDKAIHEAGTTVLEPLMHLEILTPPATVGEVSSYLQPRRAVIHEMAEVGEVKRISCEVPLAEMFGFGKALPKLTGGRASFTMAPRGYQELPPEIASRLFGLL
ncbi:MAG: Elongation factor G [Lentisphaerae bacterium ADurb.BinA184]|nr:MAG: Elongation factor G [Lentisphaerae bacterium ADurb.BinA184]